ncbi:MAG: hypothetical protein JW795_08105 [Chitinivibrionales bacterium]|nr:hypothetical protein [Chitinivibrionales bacterium]
MKHHRTELALTVLLFIIMMFVGIVQSIVDMRKNGSIQFLYPFADTFTIPLQRAKVIDSLFNTLNAKLPAIKTTVDGLQKVDSTTPEQIWVDAEGVTEDGLAGVSDIRKNVFTVNRYRDISPKSKEILSIDSTVAAFNALYVSVQNRDPGPRIAERYTNAVAWVEKSHTKFPKPSFVSNTVLLVKNCTFYTIFNRDYLRKYENEMKESSVFANSIRPIIQVLWYVCFQDLGDKAIQGAKNWLFYKPDMEYLVRPDVLDKRSFTVDPEDKPIKDNPIDSIVAFKDELQKLGVELMVMVVPGKPSVYPDKISKKISVDQACMLSHSVKTMNELNKRGVETVDLFSAFLQERKSGLDSTDELYLSQDTHWKTRGVRVVAQTAAALVKAKPWFGQVTPKADFILDSVFIDRIGDVGAMTKIPEHRFSALQLSFGTERTACYQVYQVQRDATGAVVSKRLFRDDYQQSKIIVIGDSFSRIYQTDTPGSAGWISRLAYELAVPISSIISDGGASTLVREKLALKKEILKGKKLVIWEFVERDFRYGAEGWKDIKLSSKPGATEGTL